MNDNDDLKPWRELMAFHYDHIMHITQKARDLVDILEPHQGVFSNAVRTRWEYLESALRAFEAFVAEREESEEGGG